MTECALRTRAYRRQVPFHLNGRRIRFTAGDLREIVEGQARTAQASHSVTSTAVGSADRHPTVTMPSRPSTAGDMART